MIHNNTHLYMKTAYCIIFVLFLLFSENTYAQTLISGTVQNAEGNMPMVGVSVAVKETQQGTITNEDGSYNLSVDSGEYTLVFSYIGHKTIKKNVVCNSTNPKILLNVFLKPLAQNIKEVTVTAKSEARQVQEMAMPISVVTVDEAQGAVTSMSELLGKTSGVKIRSTGGVGSSQRISVRGLEGKRIGIFIEGSPISDQSDYMSFNEIPLDVIERIEVYKGIVPAKFGGSAIGGAVNIIEREFPPKYIDLSYSVQSFNTHEAKIIFKRNNSDKGLLFGCGGFYTYSDNNYTFTSPNNKYLKITRDHDTYEKFTCGTSFEANKWWFDFIKVNLIFTNTSQEIQGIDYNVQEAYNRSKALFAVNELKKNNMFINGLEFESATMYAYTIYNHIDKAMQRYEWNGSLMNEGPVTEYGGEIGFDANDSHNRKHSLMQKVNLHYVVNQNNAINLNVVYNYAHGIPQDTLKDKSIGYKTNFENRMNSLVTGLNYECHLLNKKLTNSTSIKHYFYNANATIADLVTHEPESFHLKKSDIGFSNALRYRFTPKFLIKTSFAYDVRLPSEQELIGDGFLIVPSTNLKPERNKSLNIGTMYDHRKPGGNRFQLEMNVFYMKLENMIRYVGGFLQSNYENFGEMRTLGADMEVKWDVTSFLYFYGNATFQDLKDTREYRSGSNEPNATKGQRMPNIPYLFSNVGFELHKQNLFGGKKQESKFYIENSFVEEYLYDFEQSNFDQRRIPRSSVFNMGLEHSFRNKNVLIGLQLNNILDEEVITVFRRPMPGRIAKLKLRYIIK